MLKSLRKIALFYVVANIICLFAMGDCYAQETQKQAIDPISAAAFVEDSEADANIKEIFSENANNQKIMCGEKETTCDKATQVCLRCYVVYKGKLLDVLKISTEVKDWGRCVNKNEIDVNNLQASLPECVGGRDYTLGGHVDYTATLTVEEKGFISSTKFKAFGITWYRNKEQFTDKEGKKYVLFMQDGSLTVNYREKGFRGCEVLPIKIYNMKKCFFCPMARIIFKAANDATDAAFSKSAKPFRVLISVVFAIWLAIVTLQQVFAFTKKDAMDYIEIILKQSLKFALAFFILSNSTTLFKYFISPVLQSGLIMGEQLQAYKFNAYEPEDTTTANITAGENYYNIPTVSGKTLFTQIDFYLGAIQSQMSYMQAIGTSLFCVGTRRIFVLPKKEEKWLSGVRMMFLGGALSVLGFLLSIAFAYYFLDALLQLGLLGLMMPLMIAGWPFKVTSKYATTGLNFLLNSFFIFFFTGFVVSINMLLVNNALDIRGGDDTSLVIGGLDKIALAINDQNLEAVGEATELGSIGFLLFAFSALFGFTFMKQVQPLASKLSSGAISGMTSKIGTMGASFVMGVGKKLTNPVREVVSNKWDESGGAVGNVAKGVSKVSKGLGKLAGRVGWKKGENMFNKVSSGAQRTQEVWREARRGKQEDDRKAKEEKDRKDEKE